MKYTINISLNTVSFNSDGQKTVMENYGLPDSCYALTLDNTYMFEMSNLALHAYMQRSSSKLKFVMYFDQSFEDAQLTSTDFGTGYRLKDLSIKLTGFTFRSLNTHPDVGSPKNLEIVKDNVVQNNFRLDSSMFYKLYYQSFTTEGPGSEEVVGITNTSYTEIYSEVVNASITSGFQGTITYEDLYRDGLFTLFAGYDYNTYGVSVETQENAEVKGNYKLVNTNRQPTTGHENSAGHKTRFYLGENVISIPANAGAYLSKMTLKAPYKTYEVDPQTYMFTEVTNVFTLILNFKFNSETRLVEIDSYQLKDGGEVYKPTLKKVTDADGNETYALVFDKLNSNFVFTDFTFKSFDYIENNAADSKDITYTLDNPITTEKYIYAPKHVNFTDLFINNLKTDINITCEYDYQKFNLGVYVSIADEQRVDIKVDNEYQWFAKDKPINYGTKLTSVIEEYKKKASDELNAFGWYKFNVIRNNDGVITGYEKDSLVKLTEAEITDTSTIITEDYFLCYALTSNSKDFPTIKVTFYTWNGSEEGKYTEYVGNNDYIIQSKIFEYDSNGVLQTEVVGYYYDTVNKCWVWSEKYNNGNRFTSINTTVSESGKNIVSDAKLTTLPSITTTYPGTEFICYIVVDEALLAKIKAKDPSIQYASDIKNQNIYIRVLDLKVENGERVADIKFVGTGPLNGLEIEKVALLSNKTVINYAVSAFQAYSSFDFSMTLTDNEVTAEDITGDEIANNFNVKIDVNKFEVTYFESGGGSDYVFYSKDHGDLLKYVKLTNIQYESFIQSISKVASIPTALKDTIDSYGLTAYNLEDSINNGYYTIPLEDDEYLFIFYYKRESSSTIVTVCDKFAANDDGVLKLYSTSNNFSFTQSAVSADVTATGSLVRINTNRMNTNYVDSNGVVYTNTPIYFAILSNHALKLYFDAYNVNAEGGKSNQKELALQSVIQYYIDNAAKEGYKCVKKSQGGSYEFIVTTEAENVTYLIITTTPSIKLSKSSYIMAYYSDGSADYGNVVKLASNYTYINIKSGAVTSSIIYIQDLSFTEDSADRFNYTNYDEYNNYSYKVYVDTMFTTTYDLVSGKTYDYDKDNPNLGFITLVGSQFREYSDAVLDGFMTQAQALQYIISKYGSDVNLVYTPSLDGSRHYFNIEELSFGANYYVIAFYYENVEVTDEETGETTTQKVIKVVTNNNLLLYNDTAFTVSVMTLSNNFKFTSSSVQVNEKYLTIKINNDYMNKVYEDYSNEDDNTNKLNEEKLKYITLTTEEYAVFMDYYINGVTIVDPSEERDEEGNILQNTYSNLSVELALEMVIYYYRGYVNSSDKPYTELVKKLAKNTEYTNEDLHREFNENMLNEPSFLVENTLVIPAMAGDGEQTYYLLAINTLKGLKSYRFEKLASNIVKIKYERAGGSDSIGYELVDFSTEYFANLPK